MFKELEEIGPDKVQIAKRRPDFGRYIDKDWRHHFLLYAIDGIRVENEERLAVALALAVHQIAPSLRHPKRIGVVFGSCPYFAVDVGVGAELYAANMERKRALASSDENRIYVDTFRILDPVVTDGRAANVIILEQLVHAWMNVRDEKLTEIIVCVLSQSNYQRYAMEVIESTKSAE